METRPNNSFWYRGFMVTYDPPPIPTRDYDWHAVHDDYDGAEGDDRHFNGPNAADCVRQINEYYEMPAQLRHGLLSHSLEEEDDRDALASAGFIEED